MAEHLLPELTNALLKHAPELTLKLVIGQDDMLREQLRAGQLDMIICPQLVDDHEFIGHPILTDEAVVIASRNHPIFKAPFQMSDLCQYRWVLPPVSVSSRKWVDEVFASHNLPLPVVQVEANSISLLPRLIAQTHLLSFIARETLAYGKNMQHLREVPLKQTTMSRTICVSVRREGYLSPAAHAMVQMLRDSSDEFFRWI
jgi:DNA-binding transcriptional LysR family regulator